MRRKGRIWCILCLVIMCSYSTIACQKEKSENAKLAEASQEDVLKIYDEGDKELQKESALQGLEEVPSKYKCEEVKVDEIKQPGGVLCLDKDTIIVTDQKTDCIYKIDPSGKIIKKAGGTGSEQGKFLSPAALVSYNGEIYVLDQKNNRVQILDWDLNYSREIKLKNKKSEDPEYLPMSIAVNKNGLYVSALSIGSAVVDRYHDDDVEEVGRNFLGSLYSYQDKVYLINAMVRYYDKENDSLGAMSGGPEWLLKIEKNKMKKIVDLPLGFFITSFVMSEDQIICVSTSAASIFVLDADGRYKETIGNISGLENDESPQIAVNENQEYYIAMPTIGKIVCCH